MRPLRLTTCLCLLFALSSILSPAAIAQADDPVIKDLKIYPGKAPGEPTLKAGEKLKETTRGGFCFNIHEPTVDVYHAKGENRTKAAVVICPGGAYSGLAPGVEGFPTARWLQANGITAVLLYYRCKPYRHPVPMMDVQRALQLTRANAEKWDLDPKRIGVMGFSAGGHAASTATVHHKEADPESKDPVERVSSRPNFSVLIYPVITMDPAHAHMGSRQNLIGPEPSDELVALMSTEKQVNKQTPPTLLVHSKDDNEVPFKNSELFYEALQQNGIKSKLLGYEKGRHAYALGRRGTDSAAWPGQCLKWFNEIGVLPPLAPHPTVILAMDGGGPGKTATSHTTVMDFSTGGKSIGSIKGTFSSDPADWNGQGQWNNSTIEFKPRSDKHATWTLSGLAKGSQWQVYTTWSRGPHFPSARAPYTVNGVVTKLNQNPAPASDLVMPDLDGTRANFQKVGGLVTVDETGQLVVKLSAAPDRHVMVDGIVLVQVK